MSADFLSEARSRLEDVTTAPLKGRVTGVAGLVIRALIPHAHVGDAVEIAIPGRSETLRAEVVGFQQAEAILLPFGEAAGIGPDSLVEVTARQVTVRCGSALLGHVLDGLGQPLDAPLDPAALVPWEVQRAAPEALARPLISRPLPVGVRVIDGLLTFGEGQRVGLFAGSGVGKSTLLGQIARQATADVCVVCLVGERGRELNEFLQKYLGEGRARAVVVCATSDASPLVRVKSPLVATAIAEYFRDQGNRVLLVVDSLTRYARALREVALAAGEPPARRGYPPSVFAALPRLIERAGTTSTGSITGIYTVLVEGGDLDEPISDEARGLLDGHIVLSRELAERGHWPPVDVLRSVSRARRDVTDPAQQKTVGEVCERLAQYESHRDLIAVGAYRKGSNPRVDRAIADIGKIESFLRQPAHESTPFDETLRALARLLTA